MSAAAGGIPVYQLALNVAGDQQLSDDGKTVSLRPGDMILTHSSRTFWTCTDPGSEEISVVMDIPQSVQPLPADRLAI